MPRGCLGENDRHLAIRPVCRMVHARDAPECNRRWYVTVKVGSDAHKALFCGQFLRTWQRYDPATLRWPELDDAQLC